MVLRQMCHAAEPFTHQPALLEGLMQRLLGIAAPDDMDRVISEDACPEVSNAECESFRTTQLYHALARDGQQIDVKDFGLLPINVSEAIRQPR